MKHALFIIAKAIIAKSQSKTKGDHVAMVLS